MAITTSTFFGDPRRRNLSILAIAAVVLSILAVLALWAQEQELARHYVPRPLFAQLPHEVGAGEITHLRIQSKKNTIDVVFRPDKGWVVASDGDYLASFEQVRQTIIGMAQMQTIEPKTSRAEWLHYVNLDAPPQGDGILISLTNEKGDVLASIITGKSQDIGDSSGAMGLFVRKPDTSQSWLVRSVFQPKADLGDWLDKQTIDVDRSRIQDVEVEPADGPAYEVRREKPSDEAFMLVNPPKGREVAYPGAADGVAAAIVGFAFDGVKPAREIDFSQHATRLVTRTFDGLTLTAATIQLGPDYWTVLSAEGAPNKPDAQKEARTISNHVNGWAYKLPAYKGQLFMTTLESLLKPLQTAQPSKPAK
ncbi:MAG: DUF4340 domain-containing protein [Rhizomicrobium sp.]|jgi:hypothetical protein